MALGRSRRRTQKFVPPKLQLTSMMDMFTILLIFLLISFSSEVVRMKIDGNIQLPKSTAKQDYRNNIRLVVAQDSLWLGDEAVAKIKDGAVVGLDPANLQRSVLYRKLSACRQKAGKAVENGTAEDNVILFICDKRLSFKTINSIIKTAGMAGFPNFQFGVLEQ